MYHNLIRITATRIILLANLLFIGGTQPALSADMENDWLPPLVRSGSKGPVSELLLPGYQAYTDFFHDAGNSWPIL